MSNLFDKLVLPDEADRALRDGAALSLSLSGGKDSDAMAVLVQALHQQRQYPGPLEIVHCDMGRAEWGFTTAYVERRGRDLELPVAVVRNAERDLQDLFVQRSQKCPDVPLWPSALHRYCTSAKTSEIDRHLRQWAGKQGTVISAVGVRAAESRNRASKPVWRVRDSITTRDRQAFAWNPLHRFTTEEVWQVLGVSQVQLLRVRETVRQLRANGASLWQALAETRWAYHPSYALGADRLSCSLCILASKADLLVGIEHNPHYYADLVDLEIRTGWSFQPGRFLGDLRPDLLSEAQRLAFAAMRARKAPQAAAQLRMF